MSISGNGTISTLLNGLIWTSYNDYFNLNVNFFSTATKLAGTNGAYTGTSSDFTNTSTATNGNWADSGNLPHFFSIQWIGYFLAPVSGTYNWGCRSDDAAYLWIGTNAVAGYTTGNALLYSNNSTVGPTSISLTAGVFYPIRIQYGDYNGPNYYYLYFKLPGSSTQIYDGTGYYFNDVRPFIVNPSTAVTTMVSFTRQYSYYIFDYTGADQTFTIPNLAQSVTIQCWGAGGASQGNNGSYTTSNTGYGGGGGFTQAILNSITVGQTFKVIVGQGGINTNNNVAAPATYGGGGSEQSHDWGSASGGGRSAVQILDNGNYYEIVTAGGGGGAGIYRGVATPSVYGYGSGGAGGGLIGGDAYDGTYGGKGGTQSSGGSGGYASYAASGSNGSQYQGGGGYFGAGGGGGYYGGGGGGFNNPLMTGGGGGGSSFVNSLYATSQYMLQGIADVVAGSSYLPSGVSNIGNGAPETNITNGGGASGKNGYIVIIVTQ